MSKRRETEIWAVKDLIPYANNAKKHSKEQVKKLAKLIEQHGWTQPIVIDGENDPGVVVVGHGRRLAAIELGLEKLSVVVLYGYTRAEIDAMRLADNRVTSVDYETVLLQDELARLDAAGINGLDLGFSEKELDFMIGNDLAAFNEDMFVEDVIEAVEKQNEQNKEAVATTDKSATPIGDAFGVKRITVEQSRTIRRFMTQIETETAKKGIDALITYIQNKEV
jgi:ParB-like chromosome segregation protein Spo0J